MGQFGVMIGQLVGFLIMLMVGYGCVRLRFYGQTALDGMCSLLLNVLIPVLVFSNAVDGADRAQLAANWGVMLLTAVMDALLGAAALGDIGKLFPDSADEFAGISSLELLRRVKLHLAAAGYDVVNIDATILAQAPKLAPYREQMRANIARELQIDVLRVSVKATTEEHLGFTGSGEGMAAHAIALLERADN